MSKIYLDTCIVIYFVEKHPLYSGKIEVILNSLGMSNTICFSSLVRLESSVMPLRTNDTTLQRHYRTFFRKQALLEITDECFDQAARLRADFSSLKTPDALHLATAIHHDCDEFWTNDNRLNSIAPSMVKNVLIG